MADLSLRIKSDFEQAERDFKSLQSSSESARATMERFSNSFKVEQIDKFVEKNRMAALGVTATQGSLAGMQKEAAGLEREIQRLIGRGMDPQSAAIQKLRGEYDRLQSELGQTTTAATETESAFATMTKAMLSTTAIIGGVKALGSGIMSVVDSARKLEDAEANFIPLMGGAEKARQLVGALNTAAAETPFQFDDIQKAVTSLLPTMNGDIEKTVDTFKMLGDTAGGNAQKLDSITRGFSKAMLKGKVDMESLNMIAEAGVPIFGQMAKQLGYGEKNMEGFFKAVSSGKVTTNDLIATFKTMTSEGGIFYEGMIIASKTTSGVLSTLSDNIEMTAATIGTAFLPYIKQGALAIIDMTGAIRDWLTDGDNLQESLSAIGAVMAFLVPAIAGYMVVTKASTVATQAWTAAQWLLNAAMDANPIGLLVAATAAAAAGIAYLATQYDKISTTTKGVVSAVLLLLGPVGQIGLLATMIWKNWDFLALKLTDVFTTVKLNAKIAFEYMQIGFLTAAQSIIAGTNDMMRPLMAGMDKLISAYNTIAGKNVPLVGNMVAQTSAFIDATLTQSKNNIVALENEKFAHQQEVARKAAELEAAQKARREAAQAEEKQGAMNMTDTILDENNKQIEAAQKKADTLAGLLAQMPLTQAAAQRKEIEETQKFFAERAELEGTDYATRIAWLQSQLDTVDSMHQLSADQRAAVEAALTEEIRKQQTARMQASMQYVATQMSTTKGMLADLQTVFKNAGKESRELARMMKAVSVAEATVNTMLAYTKALAAFQPPFNYIAAGVTLAAGMAKVAAIASTPIPSAQTGIEYTVPDMPTTRNDRAAVMASAGETVSVTPRGEAASERTTYVDININESNLFRVIQRGIDTGRIVVSDRNIGSGVFA